DDGNTIVVIEHNLDVIKTADWVIDLGPEGGYRGGEIVAQGTPEDLTKQPRSHTGQFLARVLGATKPGAKTGKAVAKSAKSSNPSKTSKTSKTPKAPRLQVEP
ncbi:MAG: excinuclease ABC subunit UvrA, partial [Thermomonas sp.]